MRIKTKIHGETLVIPNAHSPNMSYASEIRKGYRKQIIQIRYQTKKKDIVKWATDNNREIRRIPENDDKTIGKCTIAKENNRGNGAKFDKRCRNNNLFITNTLFFPEKRNMGNLATWANGKETSTRQIDYRAVSIEPRSWVANAHAKGVSSPNSMIQRKTIKIDIKYDIIRTKKP